jgi:hypothetical protein
VQTGSAGVRELTADASSSLEESFKARDVEGILDRYFYRRIGLYVAHFFARLRFTPNAVTALGGIVGITAGHFYFYPDLRLNLIGLSLHVCANALDNADGQLARLLNRKSRSGRIIDSLFDHLIFLSIYIHLGLRCLLAGDGPAVVLLVIGAGLSHALQGAAADYFRNAYLYFVRGASRSDWDGTASLRPEYDLLSWREEPWQKFLLATYLNFTRQQELLAPKLKKLRQTAETFPGELPDEFREHFRGRTQPMLASWGLLMTNIRMLVLGVALLMRRPTLYFWFELTALNALLAWLLVRQESLASGFTRELDRSQRPD